MRTQLRLILSTVALTVLIWFYANQASLSTTTLMVPVKLVLTEAGSPWALRVVDAPPDQPDIRQVKMTVRGPKQAIRLLETENAQGRFMLRVKLAEQLTPGRTSRSLYADLSGSSDLLQRGLTLKELSPEAVEFEVDRYVKVPVEFKTAAGAFENALVGKPVVQEQVTARVLESKVGEDAVSFPIALPLEDEIKEALQKQPTDADGPLAVTFPVSLQQVRTPVEAVFEPSVVNVTVQLQAQSRIVSKTVRPLSVMVKAQDFFDGYEIEWEDKTGAQFTQSINCRVPVSKMELFRQLHSTEVLAYVIIDSSDLPPEAAAGSPAATLPAPVAPTATYRTKQVHFVLPAGFEDVKPVDPLPTVNLRVTRKKADTSGLPSPSVTP